MFIFCHVTENEPKEHVQKPTVSKDFPSLLALGIDGARSVRCEATCTLEVYPTPPLIAFGEAAWVLLCLPEGRQSLFYG
jgi:hypothetical protein